MKPSVGKSVFRELLGLLHPQTPQREAETELAHRASHRSRPSFSGESLPFSGESPGQAQGHLHSAGFTAPQGGKGAMLYK